MESTSSRARVSLRDTRTVTTPAATMRTYAAPAGPAISSVAVWRTEMPGEGAGPLHTVSEDQVIVLVEGSLAVVIGEERYELEPSDAIVLPAGVARQISAGSQGAVGVVASIPGATASIGDGEPVVVPWAG